MLQLVDQYTAHSDVDSWWRSIHGLSIRWYPSIVALLIVPVGMVRLIKLLVPFSVTANLGMMISLVAIFYFILIGDNGRVSLSPEEEAKLVVWPPTRWTLFSGSALCSLEGVGMVSDYTRAHVTLITVSCIRRTLFFTRHCFLSLKVLRLFHSYGYNQWSEKVITLDI